MQGIGVGFCWHFLPSISRRAYLVSFPFFILPPSLYSPLILQGSTGIQTDTQCMTCIMFTVSLPLK